MNEIDIVRDISRRFEQASIPYMLTGSMAMNYYAQPRMTRDIDIVIAIGPADVDRVAALFRPDYYVSEENIRESLAHESIFNLIHQESVIKVDCIIRKSSEYRRAEFERREKISINDFATFIVSKEDLIISKLSWARDSHSDVQLSDVRNLLATGYDADYLQRWTRELGLDTLLRECLE
jgi:arsenate reductase-like glutaredoxin family protein